MIYHSRFTTFKLFPRWGAVSALVSLALTSSLILHPSFLFAQGSLTPSGSPAPTMKSLDQIEARTPIASAPFTINKPGSYFLTTNLTVTGGDAITIATNAVTLDLSGFTIGSTAVSATGSGILIQSGFRDITISNGHIIGGVTNNGGGSFTGPGFAYGIRYNVLPSPANVHISRVSISGCSSTAISLNQGDTTIVDDCTVRTCGAGILASVVRNCVARDCLSSAIIADEVIDSIGEAVGNSASGVHANYTAQNCYGSSPDSYGVYANTAQNCRGSSLTFYGVYATTAQNCHGTSSNYFGLYADTAINCHGVSISGTGLGAYAASFCTASRPGGTAIDATVGTGCYALNGTNKITNKYNMP